MADDEVVDVAELRARMSAAVVRAGTGSARWDDGESAGEIVFDLSGEDVAVGVRGLPFPSSGPSPSSRTRSRRRSSPRPTAGSSPTLTPACS